MTTTPKKPTPDYDAIIVGARPAGAATAMLLARQGMRVLAIDRSAYGSDALSTHALMRTAVTRLDRWGLLPAVVAADTPVVSTTSFHYDDDVIEVKIRPQGGVAGLYAPRRHVLDAILVDAAVAAGAEVRHGVRFLDVTRSATGRVDGIVLQDSGGARSVSAPIVIGADGTRSGVAERVGARAYRTGQHATATIYGHFRDYDASGYHWYFGTGSGAGSIATTAGQSCVFVSATRRRFMEELRGDLRGGFARIAQEMAPSFGQRLKGATPIGPLRGYAGLVGHMKDAWGPGWALVGDAGYFRDPYTAQGISDALRDAELLAFALSAGTEPALAAYQHSRDELCRRTFSISDELASFDLELDAIQKLHRELSEEMALQVRALEQLDRVQDTATDLPRRTFEPPRDRAEA